MYSSVEFLVTIILFVLVETKAEDCRDNPVVEKECQLMRKEFGDRICTTKYASLKIMMNKDCRATCGLCSSPSGRALAPPINCYRSPYGCCWDRATPAQDHGGKGCPDCLDRHRSICIMFKWMCATERPNGDYIKMNCPVTCGLCSPRGRQTVGGLSIFDIYVRAIWKKSDHKKINKQKKLLRGFFV